MGREFSTSRTSPMSISRWMRWSKARRSWRAACWTFWAELVRGEGRRETRLESAVLCGETFRKGARRPKTGRETMKLTKFAAASALAMTVAGGALAKTDITLAMQLEPPHLDPTSAAAGAIDSVLYSNVFEGLTRFAEDGSIQPGLARSWDISDDGLTYTFTLAEGVTFHDGTAMDAEDVKFSLDRARAEDSTNAQKALFAGIEEVAVVDPQTVKVTLKEPDGNFLFNMAWGDAVIVAPESIDDIKTNPVG